MKALETYVLDGYVTEHLDIQKDISTLYRYLGSMEEDTNRFEAMQNRRHKILSEVEVELNPKAYEGYVTELQVELSQINGGTFDHLYDAIKESGKKPKWSKLNHMKQYGMLSIEFANKAV